MSAVEKPLVRFASVALAALTFIFVVVVSVSLAAGNTDGSEAQTVAAVTTYNYDALVRSTTTSANLRADALRAYDRPAQRSQFGSAVSAGRLAARGLRGAAALGRAGEDAVRGAYNIGQKVPIRVNGRGRIPDGLTGSTLSEVKNVGSLSYTSQLRDYAAYAQQTGLSFDLYVRPTTRLSGPLQDAIGSGAINLRYIP